VRGGKRSTSLPAWIENERREKLNAGEGVKNLIFLEGKDSSETEKEGGN